MMKQMRRTVLTLFVALMSLASAVAQTLRVPTIIGDNMVLQRNTTAHLWGWANAGEEVTIKASWLKEPVKVATNDIGEWIADVPTGEAA
ncbi:MAG: 9-O-acetylesterase, partial [Tidjanibacter sp.]|nr:9-O-acetylesterase [Tidjanibacter sp.]